MLPNNWKFREIIKNNRPYLVIEYYTPTQYIQQIIGTTYMMKEFKLGDDIKNKKTNEIGTIKEIYNDKIIINKSRFEITINIDEYDDWTKIN